MQAIFIVKTMRAYMSRKNRYSDRRLYFDELVKTSEGYLSEYIGGFCDMNNLDRVLEIGCGEGGNLVPFARMGCDVCGIDISEKKIHKRPTGS